MPRDPGLPAFIIKTLRTHNERMDSWKSFYREQRPPEALSLEIKSESQTHLRPLEFPL